MKYTKRILLVCSSLGDGGAERVAVNMSCEVDKYGHKVTIFYWDNKSDREYALSDNVSLIKSPSRSFLGRVIALTKLLRNQSFDVGIGFTDIPNIILFLASLFSFRSLVRISTIHTDLVARDAHVPHGRVKAQLLKTLHAYACRRSGFTVAVSDGARQSAIEYLSLVPSKTVTIYNPILDDIHNVESRPKPSLPLKLVAAGRLTEAKDYPTMIEAVKRIVSVEGIECNLHVYGEGPLRSELELLISKNDLNEKVILKGFVKDLRSKLPEYDVFLLSSQWEGLSNVLVEALSVGLPIISTDCPSGPREILMNGEFGVLVPTRSAGHMSQAIKQLSEDKFQIKKDELLKHLNKFTLPTATAAYLALIDRLCE